MKKWLLLVIVFVVAFSVFGLIDFDGDNSVTQVTPTWAPSSEPTIQLTPGTIWSESACDALRSPIDTLGDKCRADIGTDKYDAQQKHWEDLITNENVSADEAIAAFFAWTARQSQDCQTWANMRQTFNDNCP